ncbi:hypothetical protein BCR42DRAFT_442830 [Absidia repens]|uniref:Uncharacterized protein n=1 Tax=Absidia repens TaxID=90262 RepID=A0A1X2I121_9FUNG|nr:hypothetical protein BCR42DRAFT_442830 [Absidia repens]
MAIDFIGDCGYLYQLQITNDSYVASIVSSLILPVDFSDLDLFKNTIKYLFVWKSFLRETILDLKKAMRTTEADNLNPTAALSPHTALTTPHIFFAPSHSQLQ